MLDDECRRGAVLGWSGALATCLSR
jgi:hypothetical protein